VTRDFKEAFADLHKRLKEQHRDEIRLLKQILKVLTEAHPATAFGMAPRFEPMEGDNHMPPTIPPIGGPVPPGHRVIVTVTALDVNGNPAAIDGDFQALRDDAGAMLVTELTPKKSWDVSTDPPSDPTHDTTVSVADSDNMPAGEYKIDWDGPIIVPVAADFGFSVRTEPVV
jgi:hypothetical protein